MRARLAHFLINVGRLGAIQTAIVHLAVVAIGAGVTFGLPGGALVPSVAAAAWAAPWLGRRALTARPALTQRVLNVVALALVATAAVGRDALLSLGERSAVLVVTTAMSGYISAYFWFFSDPEIVRAR